MPTPRRARSRSCASFATLVSCGLSAAGALPEPLQNITESIAHTFGVPHTDHLAAAHGKAARRVAFRGPYAAADRPDSAEGGGQRSGAPAKTDADHEARGRRTTTTTTPLVLPGSGRQIAKTPTHPPAQRITPVDDGPAAVHEQLEHAARVPAPTGASRRRRGRGRPARMDLRQGDRRCPRPGVRRAPCPSAPTRRSHRSQWTLLNDPEDGAVVIAKTDAGNPREAHPADDHRHRVRSVPDVGDVHRGRRNGPVPRVQRRHRRRDDDVERHELRQRDASARARSPVNSRSASSHRRSRSPRTSTTAPCSARCKPGSPRARPPRRPPAIRSRAARSRRRPERHGPSVGDPTATRS